MRKVAYLPPVTDDMREAAQRVLSTGKFIRTDPEAETEGKAFEDAILARSGAKYAVNVANGTAAIHLALVALNVGPGHEVIMPANTFISVAHCISLVGATPVLVDIEADTYNIDASKIEAAITPRTRCILPVHSNGHSADMDAINEIARRHDLLVLEDACQALDARYKGKHVGTLSHVGTYSFVQNKAICCAGEGGMCVTDDELLAKRIHALCNHSRGDQYVGASRSKTLRYKSHSHDEVGFNYRQSEILSAIGLAAYHHMGGWNDERRNQAMQYNHLLKGVGDVQIAVEKDYATHSWLRYNIVTHQRDRLGNYLQDNGIDCAIHYPTPIHLDRPYDKMGYKEGSFPVTEEMARIHLGLPSGPGLTEDDISHVCGLISRYFKTKAGVAS